MINQYSGNLKNIIYSNNLNSLSFYSFLSSLQSVYFHQKKVNLTNLYYSQPDKVGQAESVEKKDLSTNYTDLQGLKLK